MSDPKNKNDSRTQLAAVAIAAAVLGPVAVAAPPATEAEWARSQLAQLREQVKAESSVAPEHPVLQRAVLEAQQPLASASYNQHISDHWNTQTNKV